MCVRGRWEERRRSVRVVRGRGEEGKVEGGWGWVGGWVVVVCVGEGGGERAGEGVWCGVCVQWERGGGRERF